MNSIVWSESIAVFVFSFVFICESTVDSTLARGPNDTSLILGGTVKLECITGDKNYPPTWAHQKVGSGERKDISLVQKQGDLIVPRLMRGYDERHSIVEDRSTGEYNLLITDAKREDAGTYTCTARGGLGEKRSAELSVFEPFPVCASNNTDVVMGENDCRKEPDVIEFSCKFRVHGNYLPRITWMDVNHPEETLKFGSPTTDTDGMASSKLIIKGDYVGLDTTHFRCIVTSTENADVNRFTCDTPKINVLKLSNLTESKALEAPEEVECTRCKGWSQLNAIGCEWLRRDVDVNGHQRVTFVTSRSLLNLHNQELKPGTYICVADCKIRGETCKVELLDVSYKLGSISQESVESGNVTVAVVLSVLGVVALVVVAIVLIFVWKWYKNRQVPKTDSPVSSDGSLQNKPDTPLLNGNRSSTETLKVGSGNGFAGQQETSPLADSQNGVSVDVSDAKLEGPTNTLLVESDSGNYSRTPSQQSSSSSEESRKDVSIDITDAKLGGLTKAERARRAEERAEARMRANAALRNEEIRSGENIPLLSPDDDVAEGVRADKKKHE